MGIVCTDVKDNVVGFVCKVVGSLLNIEEGRTDPANGSKLVWGDVSGGLLDVGRTIIGFIVENVSSVENISDKDFGENVPSLMTLAEYHDSGAVLTISE